MAELRPAPFADLAARLYREPVTQDALFELPRRKWWLPDRDTPDFSVDFHGRRVGNPAGPAAGPHTQMAQNILLSYVAGGRVLELKTVQVNDRLDIPRPCIDMTNVGYNVEWSQELRVEESLREYVAGAMLVAMFRRSREHSDGALDGVAGDVVYDMSVGYDLKGIQSDKVRGFLDGMRDATATIETLRSEIPAEFAEARRLEFDPHLSSTLTLSTFHGCPTDEIESICEFLIAEHDLDVIVKMNPPTLGRERLEHLLHDVMGYTAIRVPQHAYDSVVPFDESIELARRLRAFAAQRDRRLGFKFSNTLEVENHRDFFPAGNEIMYLSGQPLHVITMTLTDEFRRAVGADVPISFSAGIDRQNFPLAVACGFVPITVSTDLLRPGGYGRLGSYLDALGVEMRKLGARRVGEYVLRWNERAEQERDRGTKGPRDREREDDTVCHCSASSASSNVTEAADWFGELAAIAARNTSIVAEITRNDPRYRAAANGKTPKRIESHLVVFDCITCDKCLPVCPNAANFTYPTPLVAFDYHDVLVAPDGSWRWADGTRRFEITRPMQIACYADFCNECGNCDTFCPEYGGPYIEKPSFFGSRESWKAAAPRDGFYAYRGAKGEERIVGRIKSSEFEYFRIADHAEFSDEVVVVICNKSHEPENFEVRGKFDGHHRLDMWAYHTMRHLLDGVLNETRVNQVNATAAS